MTNDDKDGQPPRHPYQRLMPEVVLDAVETLGLRCTGSVLALNSYENRVYQVGVDEEDFVVAKFYRPARWSDAAILEEHAFVSELLEREIPVVAPLADASGRTLHRHAGFRFAVYPRRGGRWPELDAPENLVWLGRFIGRIHAVGTTRAFVHRPLLTVASFGTESCAYLRDHDFVPDGLRAAYFSVAQDVLGAVQAVFSGVGQTRALRLHGDCHPGNILWTGAGPHFVDFDDCRTGPAMQDLWMLLSGSAADMSRQIGHLLEGYTQFFDFDPCELGLVEALRALRMLHYSAWLARRWEDPAFPHSFPWFGTQRYWEEQILALREQTAALQEPALMWR